MLAITGFMSIILAVDLAYLERLELPTF